MRKILFVLLVVAACGDDQGVETRDLTPCEQLREHLIDLRLSDAVNVDKEAHREALRVAMGNGFEASCSTLSDDTIRCALQAPDSTTAAACAGTQTESSR